MIFKNLASFTYKTGFWAGTGAALGAATRVAGGAHAGAVLGALDFALFYPVEKTIEILTENDDQKPIFVHAYNNKTSANVADIALILFRIGTTTLVSGAAVLLGVVTLPQAAVAGGFILADYTATRIENLIIRNSGDLKPLFGVLTAFVKVCIIAAGIFGLISMGILSLPVGIPLGIAASLFAIMGTIYIVSSTDFNDA